MSIIASTTALIYSDLGLNLCAPLTGKFHATIILGCNTHNEAAGEPMVRSVAPRPARAIAEVEQQYEVVRTQSFSETVSYLRLLDAARCGSA